MGDIGQNWFQPWGSSPNEAAFWLQVVRYTMSEPSNNLASIDIQNDKYKTIIEATIQDRNGNPVNFSPVTLAYRTVSQQPQLVTLTQYSPGVYKALLPRLKEGAYRGVLTYMLSGQETSETVSFRVNYPLELSRADLAMGLSLRQSIVDTGNGQILDSVEITDKSNAETTPADTEKQQITQLIHWDYMLIAIAVLWLIDIALRRWWLPWK